MNGRMIPYTKCLCAVVLLVVGGMYVALGQTEAEVKAYSDALAAGKHKDAFDAGRGVLEALKAKPQDAKAAAEAEMRLKAIERGRDMAVEKLAKIKQSVKSDSPDPLLYVTPQPSEMFQDIYSGRRDSQTPLYGLAESDASFMRSYLDNAQFVADIDVVDAYRQATAAQPDRTASSKARAYLTAYIVGSHDESTYPEALHLLSEDAGRGLPIFLVDDMLNEVGKSWALKEVINALDKADWAKWPSEDRTRVLRAMAETASKIEKDYTTAIWAYDKLAESTDTRTAEDVGLARIAIYGDQLKDSANAECACTEYLKRFPSGKDAAEVKCLRARYRYDSRDMDGALMDIAEVKRDNSGTSAAAYAMVLEGMIYSSQQKTAEAIAAFTKVSEQYPKSNFAANAIMLSGTVYLQNQQYKEARDAFQRLIDFYPESSLTPKAKEYLKALEKVAEQAPSSEKAPAR
jgi:outer membrane protein assembly factor BamD (BamD/ComL family)